MSPAKRARASKRRVQQIRTCTYKTLSSGTADGTLYLRHGGVRRRVANHRNERRETSNTQGEDDRSTVRQNHVFIRRLITRIRYCFSRAGLAITTTKQNVQIRNTEQRRCKPKIISYAILTYHTLLPEKQILSRHFDNKASDILKVIQLLNCTSRISDAQI